MQNAQGGCGWSRSDLPPGQLESTAAHLLRLEFAQGPLAPNFLLSGRGCLQAQAHIAVTCTEGNGLSVMNRSHSTLQRLLDIAGSQHTHTQEQAAGVQRRSTASSATANI